MFDPFELMRSIVFWSTGVAAVTFGLKLLFGIARLLHG